jgi:aryl-alcohol dehydrogenase-like predicted oxidoreductase
MSRLGTTGLVEIGTTGLAVTRLGLGLAALGRPSYINLGRTADLPAGRDVEVMERRCHAVLDAAYATGIRYFDAARSYGLAEQFLGRWLHARHLSRAEVTVGSKWGYTYTADWRPDARVHEVKDLSLETLERQIAETRAQLGDGLALYQIHSATLESGVIEDRRVLARLARLADEGVVVGLTVSGPRQADTIRRAFDAIVDGVNPFRCVQATWNLLEPSAAPALEEAHALGWGVIVKEGLANGRLASRADLPVVLRDVAERFDVGADAVAIAAVLAQPWAHVVLSGAVTERQLASNVQSLHVPLGVSDLAVLGAIAEPADQYWTRRSQLPWT